MKKTEQNQQRKLVESLINRILTISGVIAVIWIILLHNPTTFKAAFNIEGFSAEIDCEFASDHISEVEIQN